MRKRICLLCVAALLPSCSFVGHKIIAKSNTTTSILFDKNIQNAGILRKNPDGSRVLSEGARQHVNRLVDLYGDQIGVADHDPGMTLNISTGEWTITLEYWQKVLRISQWKRDGRPTTGFVKKLLNKI